MGQRANYAAVMDVQTKSIREKCVLGMGQSTNYAAVMVRLNIIMSENTLLSFCFAFCFLSFYVRCLRKGIKNYEKDKGI